MAKAASKYISFDTAGNFVSEFEDGSAAPEAPEDGSLKSAVSYALDAIVEAAGTLPDTAAALVGARPGRGPIATRRRRWPTSPSTFGPPSATTSPSMRREPPRSPGPSLSLRPRTPGPSWCPWSRRASMWSSPRWTTARWTVSPGACCPPTTWAAPRPTWTPTRFPPTSTQCSRRPRPAARRSSSSTAPRRRSRRTPISYVTPPSAACACSPRPPRALCAPVGWSFCPPASRPRSVRRRPPRRPGKTSRLGWADDDEGPTHWRRCHKCKLFFDKEEIIELGGYCPACGTLQRLRSDERLAATVDAGSFEEWNAVMPRLQPAGLPGLPGEDRRSAREEWP